MENEALISQTKNAFDFIHKLLLESSYLVKEMEGILAEEPEKFLIGRSGGYAVTSRSSLGLEPQNVSLWLMRKFSVFFVPEVNTVFARGITTTPIEKDVKIIYVRIVLDDSDENEPVIYHGVLTNFQKLNPENKWPVKVEQLMGHMEYQQGRLHTKKGKVSFEDSNVKFNGTLMRKSLYDISSSEVIVQRVIKPTLEIFRR